MQHHLPVKNTTKGYWFVVSAGKMQSKLWLDERQQIPFGTVELLQRPDLHSVCQFESYQGHPCYLVCHDDYVADDPSWQTPRAFLLAEQPEWFGLAARASQLALFLQTHRFCGQCGHKMEQVSWELAMLCPKCQHRAYPRISPCILVGVTKPGHILLARSKQFKTGVYSLIAGFVESGETLEQAAKREVLEEVGVQIAQPSYLGSQPWPFPHSLMTGFTAEYVAGDIVCQPQEIEDAQWFAWDALPEIPPAQTLSGQIIRQLWQKAVDSSGNAGNTK